MTQVKQKKLTAMMETTSDHSRKQFMMASVKKPVLATVEFKISPIRPSNLSGTVIGPRSKMYGKTP